ncbi:DUF6114 domain-containing protein [Paractinoplanes rhizophilus]|uniref:DUF6114 domain-containing protein n=1 Tax=Paractinoplanes rhizophilus TaxID=1416877 RepID=A0ABW2HM57_9ACTN|nr:DUF6114 domain-containing protein [Actinoplanes sp.]
MATDNFWGKFRRWRRHRPFWGGLLLILSAVELYLSANLALGGVEVHLGPQGFLSYLLPLILLMCGLLAWFTPAQRLFYGIVALLTALYTFLGLNLGGFVIGMLLGIFGGALVIAWGPPRDRPGQGHAAPPTDEPTDHQQDEPADVGDDIFDDGSREDVEETQQIEIAGHDDRPHEEQQVRPALFAAVPPGISRRAGRKGPARSRRVIAFGLVPVAVTATIVAGASLQASAAECPEGLPSRSVAASSSPATARPTTEPTTPAADDDSPKPASPGAGKTTEAAEPTAGETTAAPTTAPAKDGGNPITDGIENIVDGVSNLLGIGDEESPAPSTSQASSEPATTEPAADPTATTEPAAGPAKTTEPAAGPTKKADGAKAAEPSATDDEIPCLGPRVYGKVASPDDIPTVAKKPGVMEVDSLTMYDSTYDGVVDMPTAGGGSYKALKFTMDKAVNKPFSLTIDEPNGSQTKITSKTLTTTGTVKFYTSRFEGKLFGIIPVVFTPERPPPLTLPILWFTDAKIQLSFVRCDTLTGDPLRVQG